MYYLSYLSGDIIRSIGICVQGIIEIVMSRLLPFFPVLCKIVDVYSIVTVGCLQLMQQPLMGQAPAGYMPNPALMSAQLPQLNTAGLTAPASQQISATNSINSKSPSQGTTVSFFLFHHISFSLYL